MRIVRIAMVILSALIAVVVGLGFLLPKTHIATRTVVVNAAPSRVWSAIKTVEAYPRWRGHAMTMEVIEEVKERRLVTRIADAHLPFGGTWTYELVPMGAGTQVTIIEDGVIRNPIFRCMARYVIGYHATMDEYLERLTARVKRA